jgi:hypothetical protein
MSNILEFFAPDMSMDFEELDLGQIGSNEILSANSGQQDLPIIFNVPNDESSICRDSDYDSIESKVIFNKMSIEHLLQNDVTEEKSFNYADYFSEILVNDNIKEDFSKKEIMDDEILNGSASTSFNDIIPTYIGDATNDSPQQKDAFGAMGEGNTHVAFSDANEREIIEALVNESHEIVERAGVLGGNELVNPVIIKKSFDEQMTRETSNHDRNTSSETNALLLLADLAIADICASPVLTIEEAPNMPQSETNAQVRILDLK